MINFESIRYKNFLSTGNVFTEIKLNRSSSTVIVGENGSGKSTFIDAITYALFNKPFRNINKPQLVNSINQKDMLVELDFVIGVNSYTVRRGAKPNIFEIIKNGTLVEQPGATKDYQEILEKHIVGMSYKSFTQVVVLGAASFTPFMQLSASDRREVIDNILDIDVFSKMSVLLKDRLADNKLSTQTTSMNLNVVEEKLEMQRKLLESIKKDTSAQNEEFEKEKIGYLDEIEELEKQIKDIQANIEQNVPDKVRLRTIREKMEKLQDMRRKIENKIKNMEGSKKFFSENDHCPTCDQQIDQTKKITKIEFYEKSLNELVNGLSDLEKTFTTYKAELDNIIKVETYVDKENIKILSKKNEITALNRMVSSIVSKITKLQSKPVADNALDANIKQLEEDLVSHSSMMEKLTNEKAIYDQASALLKDGGIKTRVIKQYVPIINKLVNKYLSTLNMFVEFHLDEELNETIKSRHRDLFTYSSFSEGQKSRIDIALLFVWRTIAKMKNSTNTNLLILDEIFDSSLDSTGLDELVRVLNEMEATNVFIVSHRGDMLTDKFRSQIRFSEVKNFSRIVAER